MKKLLILLGATSLTTTPIISVVSCGRKEVKEPDFSRLVTIEQLISQVKNIISTYINNNVFTQLNSVLLGDNDPNEETYTFFTKKNFDELTKDHSLGWQTHSLNSSEKNNFNNDLKKLFNFSSMIKALSMLKDMDGYSAYFNGVSDIAKNITVKEENDNSIQLNRQNNKNDKFAIGQFKFQIQMDFKYNDPTSVTAEILQKKIDLGQFIYTIYSESHYLEIIEDFQNNMASILTSEGEQQSPLFVNSALVFSKETDTNTTFENDNERINDYIARYDDVTEPLKEYFKKDNFKNSLKEHMDKINASSKIKLNDFEVESVNRINAFDLFDAIGNDAYKDEIILHSDKALSQDYIIKPLDEEEDVIEWIKGAAKNYSDNRYYWEEHDRFVNDEFINKFIINDILKNKPEHQGEVIGAVNEIQDQLGSYGMLNIKNFDVTLEELGSKIMINTSIPFYYSLNKGDEGNFSIAQMGRLKQELNELKIDFFDENAFFSLNGTNGPDALTTPYDQMDINNWSYWANTIWAGKDRLSTMAAVNNQSVNNRKWNKAMTLAPETWGWAKKGGTVGIKVLPLNKIDGDWKFNKVIDDSPTKGLEKSDSVDNDKVLDNDYFLFQLFGKGYYKITIAFSSGDEIFIRLKNAINSGLPFYYIRNSSNPDNGNPEEENPNENENENPNEN